MKWLLALFLAVLMSEPTAAAQGQVLDAVEAGKREAELQSRLIEQVSAFRHDPLGFVKYCYDWGHGELELMKGPRIWQADVLTRISKHLADPATRYQPKMLAVASGKGIGKSTLVGQLTWWGLSTLPDTKIIITANTDTQLRTKTSPEINKWARLAINSHWFNVYTTIVTSKDKKHERTWRADLIPWSVDNTEAFSGMHNLGKRIIVIFDEASSIDDQIWKVIEGALTDENTEILWLAFGNPTRNTGRFRECFGSFKHRWDTLQVDSRTVEGVNQDQIKKWEEDYGEDSDHFRILVRGEFPRAGFNQLIPSDAVAACRKYKAQGYQALPKILACDVARYGDDKTTLYLRQGRYSKRLGRWRGLSTAETTARVIAASREHSPDAIVVDSDGIGATVYDQLEFQGYKRLLYEFHGGKPAFDFNKYVNRRAEVWGLMRDALIAGMEIENDPELAQDLVSPQYGYSAKNQIQLEKKDDMKARGLNSPDDGDALAMTFAVSLLAKPEAPPPAPVGRGYKWG